MGAQENYQLAEGEKPPVLDGHMAPAYGIKKRPASRIRLYETVAALHTVEEWIDEFLTENPDQEGVLSQPLEELLAKAEVDFSQKIGNIALMWKTLQREGEVLKAEAQRLTDRRKGRESLVERLKNYAAQAMAEIGTVSVKEPRVTVSLRMLGDKIELAEGVDPATLPEAFRVASYSPNMKAVAEHYAKHGKLPEGFTVETDRISIQAR